MEVVKGVVILSGGTFGKEKVGVMGRSWRLFMLIRCSGWARGIPGGTWIC